jgi:diguanylate cyclase (GGDEF)-like protein
MSSAQTSRAYWVVHYTTYVGISAHAAFIPLFFWLGVPAMAWFNVYSVAAWIAGRIANQRMQAQLAAWLLTSEVMAHAILACHFVGWHSGFYYYLFPLIPFLIFNDQLPTRTVVLGSSAIAVVFYALRVFTIDVVPPAGWAGRAAFVEYVNMGVPLTALVIISVYFRFASVEAEQAMETLAMTDPLTRLANRRRMRDLLEVERVRFQRNQKPFTVIIADVDDFKKINDHQGHDCGDHVLMHVANIMRSVVRAQDCIARWGGEEFLFLLPDTDLNGAGIVAEKVRSAVEKSDITFLGKPLHVTMTFGVAMHSGGAKVDECVRLADAALYTGKSAGKNRVVVSENESSGVRLASS